MRRSSDIPLEKTTINIYKGDIEKLRGFAPRRGAGFIIRSLIRAFIENVEAKRKPVEIDEIDLDEVENIAEKVAKDEEE